ncbi:MAG: radical SAM protein [Gammaproteobacteria bacterium]|nr:radical SAM protein [Gammaproteobacteria bacterium]
MNLIARQNGHGGKFWNPLLTATGEPRATVELTSLRTLWINTGTLCNLTCENCYIESSPTNDALSYISRAEVRAYLDEIAQLDLGVSEIGFTGGEPFMNPEFLEMVTDCLETGVRVLILTNAMRPMMKCATALLRLQVEFGDRLILRVSVDHFDKRLHVEERGKRSWEPMIKGLQWLSQNHFAVAVAGRTRWGENEQELRDGFAKLFAQIAVDVDARDPVSLILFPEMDVNADVPEITTACWSTLGVDPDDMMCASARMVVKRKGAAAPDVVACTLLPHEAEFSYGATLAGSLGAVALNHPHCSKFCVLGGGSCSG